MLSGGGVDRSESDLPWPALAKHEMFVTMPRICIQPLPNLRLRLGANDQKRAACPFQRSGKRDESLLEQRVHEGGVGVPSGLPLERSRLVPRRAVIHANDKGSEHQRPPRGVVIKYKTKLSVNVTNHA